MQRARPPPRARPAAQRRDLLGLPVQHPESQTAGERMVGGEPRVVHQEAAHAIVAARVVGAWVRLAAWNGHARPEPVLEGVRNRDGHRCGVHVPDPIAHDRHRQPRVVRLVGNERAERLEADSDRHTPVVKRNSRQRKLARKRRPLQPLQAGRILRPQAEGALVGRLQPRFKNADEWRPLPVVHADRRERVRRGMPLVRPVEDLPVAKLTAPAQPDAAGADAAEGKRDL